MPFDANEAIIGYGKKLSYGGTQIPGTVQVDLPERELAAEEVTNDDSPDRHKEYIPGLYEPGTMGFSYRYGKTAFAAMETVFMGASVAGATPDSAIKDWVYTLPDGSSASWRGFITSHKLPAELEGVLTVEGEMQVVGKVTFSAGGGA